MTCKYKTVICEINRILYIESFSRRYPKQLMMLKYVKIHIAILTIGEAIVFPNFPLFYFSPIDFFKRRIAHFITRLLELRVPSSQGM